MKALWICFNTQELIEERKTIRGVVHSVFNRACNLVTEDDLLIPLVSSQIPNAPRMISVNIPSEHTMNSLGLERGMPFSLTEKILKIGKNQLSIDLTKAKLWNPKPVLDFVKLGEKELIKNTRILKTTLIESGNFDGIAPLFLEISKLFRTTFEEEISLDTNHYCSFIYPRMMKLMESIIEEDIENIGNMAKQIIGFGPGLTPSTDDFLSGLMTAMIYSSNYYALDLSTVNEMNGAIVEDTVARTTKVSSEMLCFASRGEVAEHIRRLMISIFSEKDEERLIKDIFTVIDTGETSGSDLIAGAYIGCVLGIYNSKRKGSAIPHALKCSGKKEYVL